ncbi:unnamed protein product [Clavelina lepadiformis]|uniref:Uncharacterized protein n=1 Tax=Clavelina lepadiformis TaxID=159417 RepID=A0ABP0FUP8_CLALP
MVLITMFKLTVTEYAVSGGGFEDGGSYYLKIIETLRMTQRFQKRKKLLCDEEINHAKKKLD